MNDTVLKVAFTLHREAGILGLPGLYAAAYVMLCRMEKIPGGTWEDMLAGTGPFHGIGGWSAYRKAAKDGTLPDLLAEMSEPIAEALSLRAQTGDRYHLPIVYELARLMVLGKLRKEGLAAIAEDDVGLHLEGDMLYCMSQDDVKTFGWKPGEIVVDRGRWELHLYSEWPKEEHP